MSYKNTDGSTQTNAIWDDPGQSPTRSHLCSERQTYRSLIVVLKRSLIVPFNKAYRRRDWNGISNSAFKCSRTCVRNRRIGNKPTHSQWKDWSWWMLQLKIWSDRNEIEMSSCKRKLTRSALHLVRVVPSGSKRHWQMENGCAFFVVFAFFCNLLRWLAGDASGTEIHVKEITFYEPPGRGTVFSLSWEEYCKSWQRNRLLQQKLSGSKFSFRAQAAFFTTRAYSALGRWYYFGRSDGIGPLVLVSLFFLSSASFCFVVCFARSVIVIERHSFARCTFVCRRVAKMCAILCDEKWFRLYLLQIGRAWNERSVDATISDKSTAR